MVSSQVAVIASNFELAEMIQNYKPEDVGEYRKKFDLLFTFSPIQFHIFTV